LHRGNTPANLPEGAKEILGDRNRLVDLEPQIRQMQPDVVLDMVLLNERQAREMVSVLTGIAGRLVVASSCDVYRAYGMLNGLETGPATEGRITEDSPLRQKLHPYRAMAENESHPLYDYDKIPAEQVVMSAADLPGTVLRLPVVYGPNDYQHRLAEHLRRMIDNRPAILMGKAQADWTIVRGYSENCAHAICCAITDNKAAGRIYNVGEPTGHSERKWVRRVAAAVSWEGEIVTLDQGKLPEHLRDDTHYEHSMDVDSSRIREELGFVEQVDFDEALKRTIAWERENLPENADIEKQYAAEDQALKK